MSNINGLSDKSDYCDSGSIESYYTKDELAIKRLSKTLLDIKEQFFSKGKYKFSEKDHANVQEADRVLTAVLANIVQHNLKQEEAELKARLAALQLQIVRD